LSLLYCKRFSIEVPVAESSLIKIGVEMGMKLESPAQIYAQVGEEIDRILGTLRVTSPDQNVAEAQLALRGLLSGVQEELDERLGRLREHGEWDTFTVAFYGETNAGKSTLIETLRILLGEQRKTARRQAFKAVQEEHALSAEALEACRVEVAQSGLELAAVAAQTASKMEELDHQGQQLLAELHRLRAVVVELKRNAPFWKKWLFRFRKPVEQADQDEAELQCQAFNAEKPARIAELRSLEQEAAARMQRAEFRQSQHKDALVQLTQYADGEIIGDGRSDFTRDTASYLFDIEGQQFALLDVPGIEGDESKVSRQIWSAVQKAHAVFYITAKAAAPQKGDPEKPGTLEKIKAHLDDQTEVWTIFNKRVTNPMQLGKPSLVSEDEEASLDVLDTQMRAQLGENYQAHISLSAQPAFLSVADCLVPGSPDEKSRAKFLNVMSPDELLAKTGLTSFRRLLSGDFVKDYRRKIRQANFHKASKLVGGAVKQLSTFRHDVLESLQVRLQKDAESSRDQVTLKLASLRSALDSLVQREVDRFTTTVRCNIYESIEGNLDNDEFKRALAAEIAVGQASMAKTLPISLSEEVENFGTEVKEVVKRFQEFAQEWLALYGSINIDGLKKPIALKIKIDNGIKLRALIGVLATAVAMLTNPVGWFVTTVAVLGLLVTFGKAVWGFFDDDYKKAQQRNAVNENLQKVAKSMRESVLNSVRDNFELVRAQVQEINDALTGPAEQLEALSKTLGKSTGDLTLLSQEIVKLGANA